MKKILSVIVFAMALCFYVPGAGANSITFNTAPGATTSGGPVSAEVTFTTSADQITIALTNTLSNPTDIAQNISDLFFEVSTGQTSGTLTFSSGLERTVAADGTYTDGSVVSAGWGLTITSGVFYLNDLGFAGPAHTLIGSPDVSNVYSAANPSIAGNGPHNPFLAGTAGFTLDVPGVTSESSITDVIFSFGTTAGINVPGQPPTGLPTQVPEPATMLLLGLGLVGVAGLRRRMRK